MTGVECATAQVVNMFRHLGAEKLPETMPVSLARREPMGA
jgi:hypothetical protein